jgi:hypothetical protein
VDNDPWREFERQMYGEGDKQYWLIIVARHEESQKAQEIIKTLVADELIYAFDEYVPERKWIKPGDLVCFDVVGKGIVAHAEVESGPAYRLHYKVEDPVSYPWVITVKNVHLYLNEPVKFTLASCSQLDFRPNPRQCIYSIPPRVYKLTEHDFYLLTRNST